MAKFCENCGSPLMPGSKFCTECGYRLPAAPASPQPPSAETGDGIRRAMPQHRMPEPKRSAQTPAPVIPNQTPVQQIPGQRAMPTAEQVSRNQTPVQRLPAQPQRPVPAKSKGSTGLAVFLSVLMLAEAAFAGFKYPGWFRNGESRTENSIGNDTPVIKQESRTAPLADPALLAELGITQERLNQYYQEPIGITAQNSPGNPAFIDVTFTQEEYDRAETLSAPVSQENPEADFPEFGIHADLKWWNLENETDTLIVKKLPVRTCAATGSVLYTYDYSLASGQTEFPTEVEITVPVQGEKDFFDGMVHYNADAGAWEEDYYTLSEDGASCTVFMTHFSESAQRSAEKQLGDMRDTAVLASAYYQTDGTSLFCVRPSEDHCKYLDVNTFLYGVGLARIPDYEKLFKAENRYANGVLKGLLEGSGGVNAELGLSVTASEMGLADDTAANTQSFLEGAKFLDGKNWNTFASSYLLTAAGLCILVVNVADQVSRGVGLGNILESNRWSAASAIVGLCGFVAGAIGAAPVAAFCALACAAIFGATKIVNAGNQAYKAQYPLGEGATLEEMAFYYYVSDYNDGTDRAVQNSLKRVIGKIPPPDGAAHALGHDTQVNIRGTGWADAFRYIADHYQADPVKMSNAIMALYQEYEAYIDRFFDGLNGQAGDSAKLRDICWRESTASYLSPEKAPELRYDPNKNTQTQLNKFAASHSTLSDLEVKRCLHIVNWTENQNESWSKIWSSRSAADPLGPNSMNANTIGDLEQFCYITAKQTAALKAHARQVLYSNTNKQINALYDRFFHDAVKEVRDQLYDDVLPFFNTQLTFFIQDESIEGVRQSETAYTQFQFTDDRSFPLFRPANEKAIRDILKKRLTLQKRENKPILLVTNVYHYLRWGCPTKVAVSDGKNGLDGKADWENVEFKTDKYIMFAGMSDETRQTLAPEANTQSIHDIRIPVRYGDKNTKGLEQFAGTWQSKIGDRQYRALFRDPNGDGSKVDVIIDVKAGESEQFKSYASYSLSKKKLGTLYSFNGKNLLLADESRDEKLNAQNFRFRVTLQDDFMVLEEQQYGQQLLDGSAEIQKYILYRNDDTGRYDNLILETDPMLCHFYNESFSLLSDQLEKSEIGGSSAVITPDGKVSITLAAAALEASVTYMGEPLSVSASRGSVTFTGEVTEDTGTLKKGRLTAIPDYTVQQHVAGGGYLTNTLVNLQQEESYFQISYSPTGALEGVYVGLRADIQSTSSDEEPRIHTFDYHYPIPIQLKPQN